MSHVVRLYAAVVTVLVFFVVWSLVGARPWAQASTSAQDHRLAALAAREKALRVRAEAVKRVVDARWARYERRLRRRQALIAAAEQRHVAQLERAYASAVQSARAANAQLQAVAAARAATASTSSATSRSASAPTAPPSPRPAAAAPVAAPAPAPPPVAVVQLPPVTSTSSSKP